jgi:hypothetical protein
MPAVRSKGGWYISPTKNDPVNKLRKEVDECLAKLEAAGVHSFNAHMLDVPDQFIAELERVGVESGDVVHFVRPGTIQIGLPSDGGFAGMAGVNEAVLEAAKRPTTCGSSHPVPPTKDTFSSLWSRAQVHRM